MRRWSGSWGFVAVEFNTLKADPLSFNTELPVEPEASPASGRTEFGKGLRSGLSGLGASTDAALASLFSEPGQPYYDENIRAAQRQAREAAAAAPRVQKLQEIKGLRDAFDWFAGTAGQATASTAPSLAASLFAPTRGFAGRLAAGAGAAFLPEAGETVLSAPEGAAPGEVRRTAALRGATSAALEAVVPAMIPGQVAKAFHREARAGVRQALGVGLRDAGAEALTEAAQDYTGQVAQEFLKTGRFDLPAADWDELLNAAAAGAVGGATMGSIPAAASLARAAVQPAAPIAQQGVERAQGLFRRIRDRSEQALRDEGEFLGGQDTIPPEIIAKGPKAIYDSLGEADQRRTTLAGERLDELKKAPDLTPEQRQELDSFDGQLHKPGVQRRIAVLYYPKKVDEMANDLKNRSFSGIKALFGRGSRKANRQLPPELLPSQWKGPATQPKPEAARPNVQEALDRVFTDAEIQDVDLRQSMIDYVAEAMDRPDFKLPVSLSREPGATDLVQKIATVLNKFGYAPRTLALKDITKAAEDAKDRATRMHSALRMAVSRNLSGEMRDKVDVEDVTDFISDYITFGARDKESVDVMLDALFGEKRTQILKLARGLGFKREGRNARISETDRFAPLLEEETGSEDTGEPDTEGLTESDKGIIYDRNEKPFARGSKAFEDTRRRLVATKTPFRVRTFRDVLERSGLEEKEVKQALKDSGVEDPVVFDTTLEDEALSDAELDSIIWDPKKGDREGLSVFEVTNENDETVEVSAVALVNTVARREGNIQGRTKAGRVRDLFAEGIALLATNPRVKDVPVRFDNDLLVQIQPKMFTWGVVKRGDSLLSQKDYEAATWVDPNTKKALGVSQVYDVKREEQQQVDAMLEATLEQMDEAHARGELSMEDVDRTVDALEQELRDTRPPKDAAPIELVRSRARFAATKSAIREIERHAEELLNYVEKTTPETLREQDKKGVREFQEETDEALVPENEQLTRMQRQVAQALITKRSRFAASKKQNYVEYTDEDGKTRFVNRKPEARFTISKEEQMMLEMALDERTPLPIQRMMFATLSRTKEYGLSVSDLNGKAFRITGEKMLPGIPMNYKMPKEGLRRGLKTKYPKGTTTAQLIIDGKRTATTRKAFLTKGERFRIDGVPDKIFEVVSTKPIDLSTPAGRKQWSLLEGWDPEYAMKAFPNQVKTGAIQTVFKEVEAVPQKFYLVPASTGGVAARAVINRAYAAYKEMLKKATKYKGELPKTVKAGDALAAQEHAAKESRLEKVQEAEARLTEAVLEGGHAKTLDAALQHYATRLAHPSPQRDLDLRIEPRKKSLLGIQIARELGLDGIPVTHDSPHRFTAWHNWRENIGRGEGAQMFWPGIYFSTKERTHRFYKNSFSQKQQGFRLLYKGKPATAGSPEAIFLASINRLLTYYDVRDPSELTPEMVREEITDLTNGYYQYEEKAFAEWLVERLREPRYENPDNSVLFRTDPVLAKSLAKLARTLSSDGGFVFPNFEPGEARPTYSSFNEEKISRALINWASEIHSNPNSSKLAVGLATDFLDRLKTYQKEQEKNLDLAKALGELKLSDVTSEEKSLKVPATYESVLKTDGSDLIKWDEPFSAQSALVQSAFRKLLGKDIAVTSDVALDQVNPGRWIATTSEGVYTITKETAYEFGLEGQDVYAVTSTAFADAVPVVLTSLEDAKKFIADEISGSTTGDRLLDQLEDKLGSKIKAIDALLKEGVKGHQYLEATSRSKNRKPWYNYVVWDGDLVHTYYVHFNKQGQPISTSMGQGHYDLTAQDQKEIREYIDKVLGPQVRVVFQNHGVELGSYGNDEIRMLLRTRNEKDVHYHEALHALFERMSGRDKQALIDAAKSAPIYNQLKKLIGANEKEALAQLEDPEERVAYMYQFWANGKLSVGPRTQSIFERIWKAIRDFFGVLSTSERAELIMQHFHEGKFRDKWFETERSFTERQLQKFETFLTSIGELAEKVLVTAQNRLRDTQVPALIEIADAMRPEKGEGHIGRKFRLTNHYLSRLNEVLRGVSEEDLAQAVKILRHEAPAAQASATVQRVVGETRALLKELHAYLRLQGVKRMSWEDNEWVERDIGHIEDYFPRVWDMDKLGKEKEQFVDMLRTKYPKQVKSRGAAEAIYNHLTSASGEGDITDPTVAYSPFQAALNTRSLSFVNAQDIAPWLDTDYVSIMSTYISQAVRRGEYTKSFGSQGQWLRGKVAEAVTQGATPKQVETAVNYIRAVDGTLGYDKLDPKWNRIVGGAMAYQNVRLLPFAIFSQLIDPLGIGLRSNNIGATWKAFKRGVRGIPGGLRAEEDRDEMYKLAERIGTIESKGMMEALGQMYSSMYMRGWPKKINDKLFKYNLMDGWNRQMRIAATETSLDFIEKHLRNPNKQSQRYLEELGLKPEDAGIFLKPEGGLKLFVEQGLDGDQSARINAAIMKFVDGSVLRPDATQRPIWASDPRWAFLFHLKQFSYSFYETIVKRALSEAQHGNFYPLYVLGSYVPFMMVADFMKDMLLNGGEPPEWKKNWGPAEYTWYGVERAGLLGPSQFLLDAGEFGPKALLGPSVEQIVTLTQNPGLGLKKALPGHQVFS